MPEYTLGACGSTKYRFFDDSGPNGLPNDLLDRGEKVTIVSSRSGQRSSDMSNRTGDEFVQELFSNLERDFRRGIRETSNSRCTQEVVDDVVRLLSPDFRQFLGSRLNQVVKIRATQKINDIINDLPITGSCYTPRILAQLDQVSRSKRCDRQWGYNWWNYHSEFTSGILQIEELIRAGSIDRTVFTEAIKIKIEQHISASPQVYHHLQAWKDEVEALIKFANLDLSSYEPRIKVKFDEVITELLKNIPSVTDHSIPEIDQYVSRINRWKDEILTIAQIGKLDTTSNASKIQNQVRIETLRSVASLQDYILSLQKYDTGRAALGRWSVKIDFVIREFNLDKKTLYPQIHNHLVQAREHLKKNKVVVEGHANKLILDELISEVDRLIGLVKTKY